MNTVKADLTSFEKLKDLKTLLAAEGPCLSVYLPLSAERSNSNSKQNELRWKELVRTLEDKVGKFGTEGRELFESVKGWDAVAPEGAETGALSRKSLAIFRSKDVFQVVVLEQEVPERASFGPHFYIRPLLAELVRERSFYLLALSQKNTRLLHCTLTTSEEVPFPHHIKTDFDEWMNQVKPDHRAIDNSVTRGGQGSATPSALAPKGSDQESKSDFLGHYFKQIDRGINEALKGKTEPMVMCAVEYEVPLYREVNSYGHLASETVHGAPNGLKAGEMHARAIEALELCYAKKVEEVLAEWNHRVGGGASSRLKDVVTACHDGRVLTLVVSDSQELTGVFDEATNTVKGVQTGGADDEDLINDAAVQTILHAGNVLVAPHNKMPNGSALAAIFRY